MTEGRAWNVRWREPRGMLRRRGVARTRYARASTGRLTAEFVPTAGLRRAVVRCSASASTCAAGASTRSASSAAPVRPPAASAASPPGRPRCPAWSLLARRTRAASTRDGCAELPACRGRCCHARAPAPRQATQMLGSAGSGDSARAGRDPLHVFGDGSHCSHASHGARVAWPPHPVRRPGQNQSRGRQGMQHISRRAAHGRCAAQEMRLARPCSR